MLVNGEKKQSDKYRKNEYALGIVRSIPSDKTLRQRMDDIDPSMRSYILEENIRILKGNAIAPGKLPNGYVPVDIDVTLFDNSKTKKRESPGLIKDMTATSRS